jgi:tight adherence protein B
VPSPYQRSLGSRFWTSPLALIGVSGFAAALLALGLVGLVRPRNRALRNRMAEFVSVSAPGEQPAGQSGIVTRNLMLGTERSLERTRWWTRFKEDLALAEIHTSAAQIVVWTAIGTVLAMFAFQLLLGHPVFALFGLGVPIAVRALIKRQLRRIRKRFAEQLPDNLQVLASALRAGHSFVGALSVVTDDAEEPSKREFRRVVADEQLGVPLEKALDVVAVRMACPDLEQVAVVAALGRETGGNTAEVLDRVTETLNQRMRLRREVMTLTAQGRLSRWIVSALPVALLGAITVLNPTYVEPLFNEPVGRILLGISALLVLAGSYVIKKIVDIDV